MTIQQQPISKELRLTYNSYGIDSTPDQTERIDSLIININQQIVNSPAYFQGGCMIHQVHSDTR